MSLAGWNVLSGRLKAIGATALELEAVQAAYLAMASAEQTALDTLTAGLASADLRVMLTTWRTSGGPFQAGLPGGGLPFGTGVAVLTGNPADDTSAISAGTGQKLANTLPSTVVVSPPAQVLGGGGVYNLGTDAWLNMAIGTTYANILPGLQPANASYNVSIGAQAGQNVTTGNYNTNIGTSAGKLITTGIGNTNLGTQAGQSSTTALNSTFVGQSAGNSNTTGENNTAAGWDALGSTVTANNCTAIGYVSLNNSLGAYNTALGAFTGSATVNGFGNTHVGALAGQTGSDVHYSTLLGYGTSATGNGAVAIGTDASGNGAAAAANTITLGTSSHQVKIPNNTTGSGSAALGANCPAVTATAPFTWFKMTAGDGSTVYVPAWK